MLEEKIFFNLGKVVCFNYQSKIMISICRKS